MISFTTIPRLSWFLKRDKLSLQFGLLTFLIIIADLFFFNKSLGLSVPIFILLTACCATVTSLSNRSLDKSKLLFFIPIVCILPGIETYNLLTLIIAMAGLLIYVVFINNKVLDDFESWLTTYLSFLDNALLQLLKDSKTITKIAAQNSFKENKLEELLTALILPFLFSIGFIALFSLANPLIYNWFSNLEFKSAFFFNNFYRPLFWLGLAIVIWPLLRYSKKALFRKRTQRTSKNKNEDTEVQRFLQEYLNPSSVTLSLIAFNLIFAIQTYLDLFYLWGNGTLPEGMTYANYVHKGAYTLIFTVVLATSFILFALNKNRESDLSQFSKGLILLWTLQNVILVISTLMRMNLYIEAFALTYLRVSVLIWMLLVLIGLGLIFFRIVFNRTNVWLIKTNLISIFAVLYVISFMNFPHIISTYNVNYAIKNPMKHIDVDYLISLGENALPAIITISPIYESRISPSLSYNHIFHVRNKHLKNHINHLQSCLFNSQKNWNSWSFRRYRLINQLKEMREEYE